jgi:hypothetical protein
VKPKFRKIIRRLFSRAYTTTYKQKTMCKCCCLSSFTLMSLCILK